MFDNIGKIIKSHKIENIVRDIGVYIRHAEAMNKKSVKGKISLAKKIENKECRDHIRVLINFQIQIFEKTQSAIFLGENLDKKEISKPYLELLEKIDEGRTIVDRLLSIFEEQDKLIRMYDHGFDESKYKSAISRELNLYKDFEDLQKKVRRELLADVEVEWKYEHMKNIPKEKRTLLWYATQHKIMIPLGIIVSSMIMFFISDDEVIRKELMSWKYVLFMGGVGLVVHQVIKNLNKLLHVLKLKKIDKKDLK